jgi:mannose-6-phosphate isomerase
MSLYKLINSVKHYDWGSPQWIPELMGKENRDKEPWAELWMGVHGGGPSKAESGGKTLDLRDLAGDLPFLFKFLAAARPLSIQAHPNPEQARAGFERENRAGIPVSAPERNYKDPCHKPEILCALSPFTAMAGFREKTQTGELLRGFFASSGGKTAEFGKKLLSALEGGYGEFLSVLFGAAGEEREALTLLAKEKNPAKDPAGSAAEDSFALCAGFARDFPGDPGILSPLYLNVLKLKPPEAIYLPAGILHAYVYGLGVECMANSDNVLRGGLTAKHIDLGELFGILNFDPYKPEILTGSEVSPSCFRYERSCGEFSLFRLEGPRALLEDTGEAIIAVTGGSVRLGNDTLVRGESAYIPRRKNTLSFTGNGEFTVFAALVPK